MIGDNCCPNKCVNTNMPDVTCNEGNGFIQITNEGNIKYNLHKEGKGLWFLKCTHHLTTRAHLIARAISLFRKVQSCRFWCHSKVLE
jgi:hypothetical protein